MARDRSRSEPPCGEIVRIRIDVGSSGANFVGDIAGSGGDQLFRDGLCRLGLAHRELADLLFRLLQAGAKLAERIG